MLVRYLPRRVRMKRISSILAALSIAAMSSACTNQPVMPDEDDLAGETEQDGELGKADASGSTFTYFLVEQDYRRCAYPYCGGVWVSRVNRRKTKCADGSRADRCYVAEFNLNEMDLSDGQINDVRNATKTLFRGSIQALDVPGFGNMGQFVASEAWRGLPDATAEGIFTKVYDNGIRCITTPCPSQSEAKLNSWRATDLEEVDFSLSGADADQISKAHAAINSDAGVIVAGYRYWWWQNGSWNKGRAATQFFTKVTPEGATPTPTPDKPCYVGGCSGQVCSDQEGAISTCEWRPEYACYDTAICAVQEDGECGWSPTLELNACLENPPGL